MPGRWDRTEKHSSAACTISLEHWETSAAIAVVHEELTRQLFTPGKLDLDTIFYVSSDSTRFTIGLQNVPQQNSESGRG